MRFPVSVRIATPLLAIAAFFLVPLSADDKGAKEAKDRENTFTNEQYGVTVKKPDAKEWKFVADNEMASYFSGDTSEIIFAVVKHSTPDANPETEPPQVVIYGSELDKGYFESYGKKGLAKAIMENMLEKSYKDVKNLQEVKSSKEFKFSKGKAVSTFSFDGVEKKSKAPRHVTIILHKTSDFGFIFVMGCAAGDDKRFAKDTKYIWDNMKIEAPKK